MHHNARFAKKIFSSSESRKGNRAMHDDFRPTAMKERRQIWLDAFA
jgi:hypothetical protein